MGQFTIVIFELAGLDQVSRRFGEPAAVAFRQSLVDAVKSRVDGLGVATELPAAAPQVLVAAALDEAEARRLASAVIADVDGMLSPHEARSHLVITYRLERRSGRLPKSPAGALRLLNVR
jgi:hypothetical protein